MWFTPPKGNPKAPSRPGQVGQPPCCRDLGTRARPLCAPRGQGQQPRQERHPERRDGAAPHVNELARGALCLSSVMKGTDHRGVGPGQPEAGAHVLR